MNPRPERCGLTCGELAVWFNTTAQEGAPRAGEEGLDAMFQQALIDQQRLESPAPEPATPGWHAWAGYLLGVIVLVLLIGGISS